MSEQKARRQKDPARDAALTESFRRMLRTLKPPRRPVDGVPIPRALRQNPDWPQWSGWPRIRVDVRFLK